MYVHTMHFEVDPPWSLEVKVLNVSCERNLKRLSQLSLDQERRSTFTYLGLSLDFVTKQPQNAR